ncbi:MFS transporter [Streptomyces sp. NBC_01766]|uniref:MFS transporter n=1 Tax=Streptomyces sp. NBC_01766 TaxID=2975936 RepID=UPI002DD79E7B|nr:MFS transporter [Streptomyces sp. NBC_01766]WSC22630.1 MFS transporter [Streptomyces sp. NBC_01766]
MPPSTGTTSRTTSRSLLLRNRDFRLLWTGSTTGKYGASVTSVALPLVAVTMLHASTLQVGLLTGATWLPWLLIGLPAGAWVDRLPRRPVMLTADAAALLLFAGIPVAARLGLLSIGYLLATAVLVGTATVFFQTAYTALLPLLVAPEDQAEGNSKLHGSESAAQLAGYGSGGFLVQAIGAANGLFVNAATFAVSFLCVLRIKHREPAKPARTATTRRRGALAAEIREGLRLTFGDPYLRAMAVCGGASNLALMAYQSILVVFLVREVHLASGTIGALMTGGGIGGIGGAFAARRLAARIGSARALLVFNLAVPCLALLIPLTSQGFGLVFFAIGYSSVSFGVVAGNVLSSTFRQQYCPAGMLGRISASASFLNYGTIPLGAVLGGALGEALGTRTALWITIAGIPAAAMLLWFSPIRRHRDLPTAPAATGAASRPEQVPVANQVP